MHWDMETTDKRNTNKDCIVDSNSAMSKGKYVPVCKKNKPNVYSHVQVTGYVLGLPNVTTWDEIEKKMGARKSKTCADKAKGKRKVSYSTNSKAYRVFNSGTRIVEENLHVKFSEETPNIVGNGPNWLFDIDALTISMNYKPVVVGSQTNGNAGTKENIDACQARKKIVPDQEYILLPLLTSDPSLSKGLKDSPDAEFKPSGEEEKIDSEHRENEDSEVPNTQEPRVNQEQDANVNNTNNINTVNPTVSAADIENNVVDENIVYGCIDDPNMPNLEEIVYSDDDEEVGAEADINNLATNVPVSPILTRRVHKDHPLEQIIRDIHSAPQTRRMTKNVTEHGMFSSVQQRVNHKDFQNCMFACFLSQVELKKVIQALTDPSWIEAMLDELLQFKLQKVWTLVDLPYGKRAIGTKWVYKNKKDDRGIVVRHKANWWHKVTPKKKELIMMMVLLLLLGYKQYASFIGFIVYQMDVRSAFLYGTIEEDVYVCQPPSFEDPQFLDKVYKVEKALYGLHQAPRAWYETLSTYLLENGFRRGTIDKTLFIKKDKDDGIFISQDKYVADILKKFDFATVKTASTPIETNKALLKDEEAEDVDVHLYRSMVGLLMYLTASRPNIMFAVCACVRFQVTPKVSHLHDVKRIFRYLKGQPKLGLWYPRDSPFNLEAFSDSDYVGASLDKKSTTRAEYVAAANCRGQVLWVQIQMLDYGFNFMNTKIYIDNESTICVVKNPVFNSKTKHIEIRHHFIRDSYEKKLIQGVDSGSGPRCQDTISRGAEAQTRFEAASKQSNDPPLSRVNTLRSGEDNMKLKLNLLLAVLVYAARHTLTAVRHKLMLSVDGKEFTITEAYVRRHLQLADADGKNFPLSGDIDPDIHTDSSNITKTQSTATPTKPISLETGSDGGPRCQETMRGASIQTRIEPFMYKIVIQGSSFGNRLKADKEDDDMASEDSSKQGRMIEEIDQDAGVTLVTPTKVSSQEDQPKDQLGVLSAAKVLVDAARVHTYSKRRRAVSTGSGRVSTASRIANITPSDANRHGNDSILRDVVPEGRTSCSRMHLTKDFNEIKFSTCTLLAGALTWWNSHVRIVGYDVANNGTDVTGYNQRFQELALLCVRIFPEESDKVERTDCGPVHYAAGTGEEKEYSGTLPCWQQRASFIIMALMRCKMIKSATRVGHLTRDCGVLLCSKLSKILTCYECGNQGHYKSDCPKLRTETMENQAEGTGTHGMVLAL
ncbi:putative ribonuclease H-like domain-containing protein [Tanacetum coccineum]